MRVPAVLGAALLLGATLASAAAPAGSRTLLALSSSTSTHVLLHVDARTLAPVDDRTIALPPASGPFARSPDNALLAVSTGSLLTLIDTVRMVKTGTLEIAQANQVTPVAWPTSTRLYAVASRASANTLLVIDPIARSVIARVPVTGGNSTVVSLLDGIAYLAWPYDGVKPARVVLVDSAGGSRVVQVARILAGIRWHRVRGVQIADIRQPGLTADPAGGKAYLVGAGNLVAEIELSTLAVTYHKLVPAARRLARVEKLLSGPTRYARWLGNGQIAVAGTNAKTTVGRNKSVRTTWFPAGVTVVDARSWSSRMIDRAAGGFVIGDGALIVSTTRVVKAYETDSTPRFSLRLADKVGYVTAFGDLAYVWGEQRATILDLESGTVVAAVPNPHLYVIGAD